MNEENRKTQWRMIKLGEKSVTGKLCGLDGVYLKLPFDDRIVIVAVEMRAVPWRWARRSSERCCRRRWERWCRRRCSCGRSRWRRALLATTVVDDHSAGFAVRRPPDCCGTDDDDDAILVFFHCFVVLVVLVARLPGLSGRSWIVGIDWKRMSV